MTKDKLDAAIARIEFFKNVRGYWDNKADIAELETALSALLDARKKIDGCPACKEPNCGNCGAGRIDDGYCVTAKLETFSEESNKCTLYSRSTGNYCQRCGRKLK